jgi:hypothetical protein
VSSVNIVVERNKTATDCVMCGDPVRVRQECVRAEDRTTCIDCYENLLDLRDLTSKWWPPLIVRQLMRTWRMWR